MACQDVNKYDFISLLEAKTQLLQGKVVGVPTDTVNGLACKLESQSLRKLYRLKKRTLNKPVVWLVPSFEPLREVLEVNELADYLINLYWPGALTLILPIREQLFSNLAPRSKVRLQLNNYLDFFANEGGETDNTRLAFIGVRVPSHSLLLELLKELKQPLAVTSANLSGEGIEDFLGCPVLRSQIDKELSEASVIVKLEKDKERFFFVRQGNKKLYEKIKKDINLFLNGEATEKD